MAPCFFILFTLLTFSLFHYGISGGINYTVTNVFPESPGGIRFEKEIGIPYTKEKMEESANFIWNNVFEQKDPSERKPLEYVNLFITEPDEENKDVMAYRRNSTIVFSVGKLEKYVYSGEIPWNLKMEFTQILYHEMTHVLQWNFMDQGLREGIAEYTKIKADLMQPGFTKRGAGVKWDEGYGVTARFLEYCDEVTPGFVPKLHDKMKDGTFDVKFFEDLTGKPVDQLWKDYMAKYQGAADGGGGGGDGNKPARRLSSTSSNLA